MAFEIRQSTQVIVPIGVVVAVGDGFTPVTTLNLGTADEAELLKHGSTTVVDISGATFAAITSMDGHYGLTLTTSHTDTLGMLRVAINDDSLCLPVVADFMVLSQFEWDRKYSANSQGLSGVIAYGTAQGGSASTIQLAAATAIGANDRPNGMTVAIIAGTGANQSRPMTDWVDATDTATVSPDWVTAPSSDSVYVVFPSAPGATTSPVPAQVYGMEANVLTATAIAADAITAAKIADDAIGADQLATDAIGADALAASGLAEISGAVWDEVVDGTTTAAESVRLQNAAMGGKASGLGTATAVYRDLADTKDRIDATVDADGNRTAVTLDLT